MNIDNNNEHYFELNSYIPETDVEGPFLRFAIWVQGCSIRCKGCKNRHMWDYGIGNTISVSDMFSLILKYKNIEGITLVGGEPFDQAIPLTSLCLDVKKKGLGVVTFTGYSYEYLKQHGTREHKNFFDANDMVIDGAFIAEKKTSSLPWVGSYNQRYIHVTKRYKDIDFVGIKNRHEVRVDFKHSKVSINGMGSSSLVAELLGKLNLRKKNKDT